MPRCRALQKVARAPAARREQRAAKGEAEKALAEAQALKLQVRLEALIVWQMAEVKQSARLQDLQLLDDLLTVDQRTRNVRLGECQEDGWQGGQGDEGGGAV